MQGQLLIAHPLLNDGFFNRSVIYITNHDEEGTVGFSLNFKTQFMLRDVRPHIKNGNFPIYEGGPVGKNQLFYLHTLGKAIENAYQVDKNIYIGGDFNALLNLIEHNQVKPNQIKFFSGYSGWQQQQLENELERNSWLVRKPNNPHFFSNEAEKLWGLQLSEIKSTYRIFSEFSSDPSAN